MRQTISATLPTGQPLSLVDPGFAFETPESKTPYTHMDALGWTADASPSNPGSASVDDGSAGPSRINQSDGSGTMGDSLGTRVFAEAASQRTLDTARFKILKVLGEGAAGRVYLAFDRDIGREVAIKLYHPESGGLQKDIAREIRISGRVTHPGVTPVYDVGRGDGGEYYCVMKHLVGCTLGDLIGRLRAGEENVQARFTFQQRANLIVQLLRVLVATHKLGIIHRDIKPENIVIGPAGDVVLIDWSIALDTSESDGADSICGTPSHMAPEQATVASNDERTDVYGAAATFYELLCLEVPAPELDSDLASILRAIPTFVPPRVDTIHHVAQGYAPSEYADFLERCLARDPKERYQSALAMLQALEQIQNGRFQATCPRTNIKSRLHRLMQWLDTNPYRNVPTLWAGLAGTAIGLAALGMAIGNLISN